MKKVILPAAIILFALTMVGKSYAQEMKSQNFVINGGNLNMTSGNKSSANFKLSDVVGQTSAAIFTAKGYLIQSGFLNGAAADTILFTVSPPQVDFGTIYPNNPVEKTLKISISNGNTNGYTISVAENQPLSTSVQSQIPDTSCNSLKNAPCTYSRANLWTDINSFGLGYSMGGKTVLSDFSKSGYYRSFAAQSRSEKSVLIMQSNNKKTVDTAVMTLKLDVSKQQPVGVYKNIINFTAIAGI